MLFSYQGSLLGSRQPELLGPANYFLRPELFAQPADRTNPSTLLYLTIQ